MRNKPPGRPISCARSPRSHAVRNSPLPSLAIPAAGTSSRARDSAGRLAQAKGIVAARSCGATVKILRAAGDKAGTGGALSGLPLNSSPASHTAWGAIVAPPPNCTVRVWRRREALPLSGSEAVSTTKSLPLARATADGPVMTALCAQAPSNMAATAPAMLFGPGAGAMPAPGAPSCPCGTSSCGGAAPATPHSAHSISASINIGISIGINKALARIMTTPPHWP